MNMNFIGKLPIPQLIKQEYPINEKLASIKANRDAEIKKSLRVSQINFYWLSVLAPPTTTTA